MICKHLLSLLVVILNFATCSNSFLWPGNTKKAEAEAEAEAESGQPTSALPRDTSPLLASRKAKEAVNAADAVNIVRENLDGIVRDTRTILALEQKKIKKKKENSNRGYNLPNGQTVERNVSITIVDESALVGSPAYAAKKSIELISHKLERRLERMFEKTKSPACRAKIAEAFSEYIGAIGGETSLPYTDHHFKNECPHKRDAKHPDEDSDGVKLENPSDLKILYLIMTHEKPLQTVRLVSALEEKGHTFVIHIDAKNRSNETQEILTEFYADHPLVHVLPDSFRVGVNWGGFSIVESTLKAIQFAFGIGRPGAPFDFHRVINLASTSYPLKSNVEIQATLNKYPLDVNLVEVRPSPNRPISKNWHKYVECDDAVHRIYRMGNPRNISMFVGSQWFIITREFAEYMVNGNSPFVTNYIEYARNIVVADENFFGTVLMNSPFCGKHFNKNFLHMQFDDWENNKKKKGERDPSKCLMPNPDHCGRSPTTMTYDYLPVLELSTALFARKFSEDVDIEILDVLDRRRGSDSGEFSPKKLFPDDENVLIVKKDSVNGTHPLCLTRSDDGKTISVQRCFGEKWQSQAGWEKRYLPKADMVDLSMRWSIGPCSTDGDLTFVPGQCLLTGEGRFTKVGPTCSIQGASSGKHSKMCLDVEGENMSPGGNFLMYPCTGRWNQYFSFGGNSTKNCSIHLNIPRHLIESKTRTGGGKKQVKHLCVNAGGDNGSVRTANCVDGDDSGLGRERWMEVGNEWLLIRFSKERSNLDEL